MTVVLQLAAFFVVWLVVLEGIHAAVGGIFGWFVGLASGFAVACWVHIKLDDWWASHW